MRKLFLPLIFCYYPICLFAQHGGGFGGGDLMNRLPDYIPPTPEASALLKADNLSVGYTTGSPNVNISLFTLQQASYSLPVTLNYSSTGIKVDEYASMVGLGWTLNYGGVISRTVAGRADEVRGSNYTNFNAPPLSTQDQNLLDFLKSATADRESDIFSFSFPGYSGKFYLDSNYNPVQLSMNNLKIQKTSPTSFLSGFIITTDDGTDYYFQDVEISRTRNPYGQNCQRPVPVTDLITSWYLTKIVLPSRQRQINFTYTIHNITFESSISQTISKVIGSESYPCYSPSGTACPVGSYTFTECISRQTVSSKFITKIQTSDGDKVEFNYDGAARQDLEDGKRLAGIKATNRFGRVLKDIVFTASYQSTTQPGKRMFLENVKIRGTETGTAAPYQQYIFTYNSYNSLPARLSTGQDWYGYYNGKSSNGSLIPALEETDQNYDYFNGGTSGGGITFGDRSIDTNFSVKGLLTRVTYPTGGYDNISYIANRYSDVVNGVDVEKLAGGHSVSKITSYSFDNNKVLEKYFYYRNPADDKPSAVMINKNFKFSQYVSTKTSGYMCQTGAPVEGEPPPPQVQYFEGPGCSYAIVTSNPELAITAYNGQHLYHQSVIEYTANATEANGYIEHKYAYFTTLLPNTFMGNTIMGCSFNVVADLLKGETNTNVYKGNGSGGYELVKSTDRTINIYGMTYVDNYVVRKNYDNTNPTTPPHTSVFDAFDVSRYAIYSFTNRTDQIVEKEYQSPVKFLTRTTTMQYGPLYTYPKTMITTGSDGSEIKTERKYPPDFTTVDYMLNRNIISPVLEEKQWNNNVLQVTKTNSYADWFTNSTVIAPQQMEAKIGANTQTQKITFFSYDTDGNVQEIGKENDQRLSYIWDYNNNFCIGKVQNASPSQVAITSFEANGNGSWTFSGTPFYDAQAPTGRKVYSLNGSNNITRSGLGSTNTYIVSYWTKNTSAFSIAGTQTGYPISGNSAINGWKYFEHKITGQTQVSIGGNGLVDELRLYPGNALVTTFTYEPMVGVTSQCDPNNRVIYYHYDGLQRLVLIRDQERNIIKKFCYNYADQSENCNFSFNDPQSGIYTRECGTGYTGGSVTYNVPEGIYLSTVSLADANNIALADVNNNGQSYANAAGTCTVTCTTSNCPGADKKCINNICETGYKITTSSTYDSDIHKWVCVYHYEFSDGSWSPDYQEITTDPCSVS